MTKIGSITNTQDNSIFFGFVLKRIKSDNPSSNARDVFLAHRMRMMGLTKILYREDQEITYCLRTIVAPIGSSAKASSITIGLIVKVPGNSADQIESLSKTLKILLQSNFDDHVWQEITDPADLENFINPIDWNKSRNFEIRRKIEKITLNASLPTQNIGYLSKGSSQANQTESIDYVHPYAPTLGGFEQLLRTMVSYQQPIVLTALLSPTKLTDKEVDQLHTQIELCGEAAQYAEKTFTRSRAKGLTESLSSSAIELQQRPFHLGFYISAENTLDALLLKNAGLALSDSSSGNDVNCAGCEVIVPQSDDLQRVINTLSKISCFKNSSEGNENGSNRFPNLVGASEASTTFYFPINADGNMPGIDTFSVKTHPLPKELIDLQTNAEENTRIGTNNYYGFEQDVLLDETTRRQHTYIVGQTGTGKTTLMKTMIQADLKAGNGIMVIDPHGELYHDMLSLVPEERVKDVVLFDPSDIEYPMALNMLEVQQNGERDYLIKEMRAILKRFIREHFDLNDGSYSGPVFYQHVMNNMLLAMSDSENPGTIIEFYAIFQSDHFWRRWLPLQWENAILRNWVDEVLPNVNYNQTDRSNGTRHGDYYSGKFMDFVSDSRIRNIFGQPRSTVDFTKAIEETKIVFVNLSKGLLGEANASFLGMILMAKITAAFMGRAKDIAEGKQLKPYYLYVDEFQSIATENFSILLSEARKFGLGLVLANQYLAQVDDRKIKNALLGNVGTIVAFRLGLEDADILKGQFHPDFSNFELTNLPNYMAMMRTNVKEERVKPATLRTIPPSSTRNDAVVKGIIQNSRMTYGTPKKYAEKLVEISLQPTRVSTIESHFDHQDVPSELRIENLDFSEIINQGEQVGKKADKLSTQGLNEMIVYLVNQSGLQRDRIWKILDKLTSVAPNELFFSHTSIEQLLKTTTNSTVRRKLEGISNAKRKALVFSWMEWLENKCRDESELRKFREAKKAYDDSRWQTAVALLKDLSSGKPNFEEIWKMF